MTSPVLVKKCRTLRRKGFTLGKIIKAVDLPKTTVYDHIRDIPLPKEVKEKIAQNLKTERKKGYQNPLKKANCKS